ncbi:chalcone isomerase family protein [Shewanella sp. MEBiC00475]|uniref:chalcone isomerase family protein n=1 Tax=Shewanella sp. MEBiC00475 TaxID=2575361 RepID=UPI0010BF79CC|nr:chalcone isomerase family protein [Shewanella sp. MEBiC00475]
MKTLHNVAKENLHFRQSLSTHWLVELLFGMVGAVVLALTVMFSINDASASESDIGAATPLFIINTTNDSLVEVGTADMSLLWFDIYSAKLFSIDGKYRANRFPLILDIKYHRDIDAIDLVTATIEQWQHLGLAEENIELYRQQLVNAWPDVKEGDRLTFRVNTPEDAAFLLNDAPYYQVSNTQFPAAFLDIWLSEKTSHPELRKQLIGVN